MPTRDTDSRRAVRSWGTVHASAVITIDASPERLIALYLDFAHWSRLFPATIRGVRLVRQRGDETTVEVDHRTEGRVVNVLRRRSASEIELEEFKPRYAACFLNRFDAVAGGTRYAVTADVRLRMPYALLAPLLGGFVRRSMRRHVLEPMRAAAERGARAEHGGAGTAEVAGSTRRRGHQTKGTSR